ncbi:MAG: hypothetical protein IJS39_07360, partial [Synergistaceae bacterium]|nr:hypothetical protein [Synergistaceae bacterium]
HQHELVQECNTNSEAIPDYDAAFDEAAYSPDVQDVSVIVDDIPADHEPDTQEVSSSYEDVRRAYMTYEDAMDDYFNSNKLDIAKKHEADVAYEEYLRLLVEYRKDVMPKRDAVLHLLHERFDDVYIPAYDLAKYPREQLVKMSHACGIHASYFGGMSKDDMAVRLLRDAGIEPGFDTDYECAVKVRKAKQRELHEVWQQRRVLRKALRLLGKDSEEARILMDMCCNNTTCTVCPKRIENMLNAYKEECKKCAKGRRYEAESRGIFPAPVQEEKPAVVAESPEPEVQVVVASTPKAPRVYRKKSNKPIRKFYRPSWIQSVQLIPKTHKHSPTRKPLVKLTKSASTVRVKKF